MAVAEDRSKKKTSVTQLVHSTIGFGLMPAEPDLEAVCSFSLLGSPEEETMASRMQMNSKTSVSSDKVADSEWSASNLDLGSRAARGKLPKQPSQDG